MCPQVTPLPLLLLVITKRPSGKTCLDNAKSSRTTTVFHFCMLVHSGTFAVVSLMTGSVVEQLVPTPLEMNSSSSAATELEAQRIGVASAVALLSGIIMVN